MGKKKDRSHIPEVGDYIKITNEKRKNFGLRGTLMEEKHDKQFTVLFDQKDTPLETYYETWEFSIIKKQVGF